MYRDYIFAARMIEQANTLLDYGPTAAWTAQDLRDLAASVAAEEHVESHCPICRKPVTAAEYSPIPVITMHEDTFGRPCVASGQPLFTALPS